MEDFIESSYCQLKSEAGDITASRIKTGSLKMESESGDIICGGAVQGNVVIKSERGNVISDKRITGPSLDVTTESGDIRIAASYAETSKFSSMSGMFVFNGFFTPVTCQVMKMSQTTIKTRIIEN